MGTAALSSTAAGDAPGARRLIILLNLSYLLAFADRIILSLLLVPIQADFNLTDTQLGLLSGLAFGLWYAVLGVPAGHIADRANRRDLIVWGMLFWSAMTVACGFATGFLALFLFRMGVGTGEAVLHPAATSMITDAFPPERRASAMGAYLVAGAAAIAVSMLIGGPLVRVFQQAPSLELPGVGALRAWQAVFIAVGVPGFLLAAVLRFAVAEPERRLSPGDEGTAGWGDLGRYIAAHRRTLACHVFGVPITLMGSLAMVSWLPLYFDRLFGWNVARASVGYALTGGLTAIAGALLAGRLPAALRRRGYRDANFRACFIGGLWLNGFGALAMLAGDPRVVLALLSLSAFASLVPAITAMTCVGEIAPNRLRARVAALYSVSVGVIANALGVFLVGVLSQYAFEGADSIRDALLATFIFSFVVGGGLILYGLPAYRRSLERTV